jgi:hypothetical protein
LSATPFAESALLELPLDDDDFSRHAYEAGWTDGLPVVAPTPERTEAMLAAVDRDPLELLGIMAPGQGAATVHALAVNAVMAGCSPEHFRVLVAAVRAVLLPEFNLNGVQATTNPIAPAIMVSGPAARELGFNGGANCFGPGPRSRSNAVVGRALRFCLLNIGYATPGEADMATQGSPGKYTFCFAENQEANPWEPHHTERGFAADASCVTVFPVACVSNVLDFGSRSVPSLLTTFANLMASITTNNMQLGQGDITIVLGPEHAGLFARDRVGRDDAKKFLHLNARTRAGDFPDDVLACVRDWRSEEIRIITPETPIPVVNDWRNINIVVAGGPAGSHSSLFAGFEAWSTCVEI